MPKSYVFVYDLAFRKCNIFGNFLEISENISKSLEVIMSIIFNSNSPIFPGAVLKQVIFFPEDNVIA